ncbi:MAG: hypothetical protein WB504_03225 [Pseudolabrys sp.]
MQLRQFVVISVTNSPDCAWTEVNFATTLNNCWTIGVGAQVAAFSPETIELLRSVLDDAWKSMRPEERVRTSKTAIGVRILEMAAAGERDPIRLRAEAATVVVTAAL